MPNGKYTDKFPKYAEAYARQGLSDSEICENLSINRTTFYNWIKKHPKFKKALEDGRAPVILEVENALLKRALGFEYEEVTTEKKELSTGGVETTTRTVKKQALPSLGAIAYWLNNRAPDRWRSNQQNDDGKDKDDPTAADLLKALAATTPTRYAIPLVNGSSKIQDSASGKAERQD